VPDLRPPVVATAVRCPAHLPATSAATTAPPRGSSADGVFPARPTDHGVIAVLQIGFIGTGGIAQRHIRNLQQLGRARVVAFCDIAADKAEQAARAHGATAYTDFTRMLEAERLDAVFLCTPPFVRAEPILAVAARGLALFCEKPPAFDAAQGRRALAAIGAAGVTSNVGFMYRWLQIVAKAKELMAGRKLAALRSAFLCGPAVEMNLPAWFYLKDRSGGPLMDQAIHVLDLHRYLAGEVATVHALANNQIRPKTEAFTIEDTYTLNLAYDSGVIASHTHSWACAPALAQIELISAAARLTIDLFANRLTGTVDGVEITYAPRDDCYLTEVDNFLTAVERHDPGRLRSPYADALNTCAVTWAGLRSVETGRVEVPERL